MSASWAGGSDTRWRTFRQWLLDTWQEAGRTSCEIRDPGCTVAVEQVDHIVPLSRGGAKYDPANCRPACAPCNRARSDREPSPQPQPRPHSSW